MRRIATAVGVLALLVMPGIAAAQEAPAKPAARAPIYDESADAQAAIDAALAKARKENRRVLIQWGANWCGWCHLLHDTMKTDRTVARELLYEYDVVLVDIGRFDKNLDLAERYGATFKKSGVPFITVLDAAGKVLANQETGSLENPKSEKPSHDSAKVLEFLKTHRAPPLIAQEVLQAGLSRAEQEGKQVFLHFGAPWCGWCHRLEGWMARPAVARVLEKDFVDVKIDLDRMTGANDVYKKYCQRPGGIPWFAFVDRTGKAIITSDGPRGNVGCPATDDEIEHFVHMLRKVAASITTEEIEALGESLKQRREEDKR